MVNLAITLSGQASAWLSCNKSQKEVEGSEKNGLHGAEGGISEAAALAFSFVVRHVEMLLMKEALEFVMI